MRVAAAVLLTVLGGCTTRKNPAYCDDTDQCRNGTVCDLTTHGCVPADDASVADGIPDGVDAPSGPIVSNGALADLVLGQPSFTIVEAASTTATTVGCAIGTSTASLYAGEYATSRVLVWSPLPTTTNAPAQLILGKTSFTDASHTTAATASALGGPNGVGAYGTKLAVADSEFSRVLVWNPAPTSSNQTSTIVLGQMSATDNQPGTPPSSTRMRSPDGVWTDGVRLVVADSTNWRVLIWNSFPTSTGQAADVVLGQADFISRVNVQPPTASSLLVPSHVHFDGTRLYVSDQANNRVLIWNSFPTANNQPADVVLGQSAFTTKAPGLSETAMSGPTGLAVVGNALFVADTSNDRVLVFQPIPTTSGAAATHVLGQLTLDAGANNPAPTQSSIDGPTSLAAAANVLFVADCQHRRILRFQLNVD